MADPFLIAPSFSEKELPFVYALSAIKPFRIDVLLRLRDIFGNFEDLWTAPEEYLKNNLSPGLFTHFLKLRHSWDIQRKYEELCASPIRMLTICQNDYPSRLRSIPDAPIALFVLGELPPEDAYSVAVIGSRDCSPYGRVIATELGEALGLHGISVISGMARGIDGLSQTAAIDTGGASYAVLGSGVDICYPLSNRALYDKLIDHGGILSEYVPGTPAISDHFPPRNRIVSGLSDAVVVVEARQRSGTLITVDMALEQGREIYAVPGRITDQLSDGCNALLNMGAHAYLSPDQLIEELMENVYLDLPADCSCSTAKAHTRREKSEPRNLPFLPDNLCSIYRILEYTPTNIEELWMQLKQDRTLMTLQMELMQLCLEGLAEQVTQGCFCKKR